MNTYSDLTEKQIEHNQEILGKDDREMAVIELLDVPVDEWQDVNATSYDDKIIEYGKLEYLVLEDNEVEDYLDEYLDELIDETILPEIPKYLRNYFDSEKWKQDAIAWDGAGHFLALYDGVEEELDHYYLYRRN